MMMNNLNTPAPAIGTGAGVIHIFRFAQGNSSALGKKRNEFLLFCARFFVTLQAKITNN
jgi:hypothetical protein